MRRSSFRRQMGVESEKRLNAESELGCTPVALMPDRLDPFHVGLSSCKLNVIFYVGSYGQPMKIY